MKTIHDTNLLFSLREAAVLSRLPEDKLRREVERKVITPKAISTGSTNRLLFVEFEILYFAMLNSIAGTLELTPPTRTKAWRMLMDLPEVRVRVDKDRPATWAVVYQDVRICSRWVANLN